MMNETINATADVLSTEGGFFSALIFWVSAAVIIFGGVVPFVFQYREIVRLQSGRGFSLYTCLILCLANILQICFWFVKGFQTVILIKCFVMLACMLIVLELWTRMSRKQIPKKSQVTIWNGHFFSWFWAWNDVMSFVFILAIFAIAAGQLTHALQNNLIYCEILGAVATAVEVFFGVPQLIRNFKRKSTKGMSVGMVVLWFVGDIFKTAYFLISKAPFQFWVCSSITIITDILLMIQVYVYKYNESLVPSYVKPQDLSKRSSSSKFTKELARID